ncbi:uncharacterized protein EAF01_003748 [Botrytis porri]|uniref:Uncharacterized protein n=1 Tax=Botrytis porri TaxID=87229 RepID=A0A4Z1KRM4_9HELO|nr:uncharacterized protein EAF01_003748 [Botrytis porri]KAF7910030.1 hypothetical protein EAF01_003748 [Botrytis porri]TGO87084.1 hypothetical protein BPOR_0251g00050 [Botrytis porri]
MSSSNSNAINAAIAAGVAALAASATTQTDKKNAALQTNPLPTRRDEMRAVLKKLTELTLQLSLMDLDQDQNLAEADSLITFTPPTVPTPAMQVRSPAFDHPFQIRQFRPPFDVSIHSVSGPIPPERGGTKWTPARSNAPHDEIAAAENWEKRKQILYHFFAYNYFDTLPGSPAAETALRNVSSARSGPEVQARPRSKKASLGLLNLTDSDFNFLNHTSERMANIAHDTHYRLAIYLKYMRSELIEPTINPSINLILLSASHREALLFRIFEYNKDRHPRARLMMRFLTDADVKYLDRLNTWLMPRGDDGRVGSMERIISGVSDFVGESARGDRPDSQFDEKVEECLRLYRCSEKPTHTVYRGLSGSEGV